MKARKMLMAASLAAMITGTGYTTDATNIADVLKCPEGSQQMAKGCCASIKDGFIVIDTSTPLMVGKDDIWPVGQDQRKKATQLGQDLHDKFIDIKLNTVKAVGIEYRRIIIVRYPTDSQAEFEKQVTQVVKDVFK
jgi:hypothetical protein